MGAQGHAPGSTANAAGRVTGALADGAKPAEGRIRAWPGASGTQDAKGDAPKLETPKRPYLRRILSSIG